jgi:hypothetical protein
VHFVFDSATTLLARVKDVTADYSESFGQATLVTNLPNYASAIVTTDGAVTRDLFTFRPCRRESLF